MRKIIPTIVCFIILITLFVCLMMSDVKKVKVYALTDSYNTSTLIDEESNITIKLLVNQDKSYFTEKSQIRNSYISDYDSNDIIKLKVLNVKKGENKIKYKDETYFDYYYTFKIDLSIESNFKWEIEKAYLNIDFFNDVKTFIDIGTFSFYKVESYSSLDLSMFSLKGLLTEIKSNNYLSAIVIGIRNNSASNIKIKSIKPMDCNLFCASDSREIQNMEEQDTNSLLGYSYDLVSRDLKNLDFELIKDEQKTFFIPLYYQELFLINKFALEITYTKEKQEKVMYLEPFVYFSFQNVNINLNNLKCYVYANI